jgi:COP9 signalosome complex subunit 2
MLYNIYALEIQLRSERKDTRRLHELYQRAVSITNAVPAPRTVAVVHECGAKLFLQKQLWNQAHKALVKAFQSYDEAGDARRISCLKYLVVSAVLSDSKVNPFDLKEAAALQDNPEVAVLTDLIDCSTRRDVQRFMQILGDPIRGRTLSADAFLRALIEPLISQMQGAALVALARPYSALRLGYIAKALAMTAADAERLCVRLILERQLPGAQIDQLEQVLYLDPAATRAAAAAADAAAKGNQNAATAPATETAQAQVLAKLLQQNADALRAATVNISVPWTRQLVLA